MKNWTKGLIAAGAVAGVLGTATPAHAALPASARWYIRNTTVGLQTSTGNCYGINYSPEGTVTVPYGSENTVRYHAWYTCSTPGRTYTAKLYQHGQYAWSTEFGTRYIGMVYEMKLSVTMNGTTTSCGSLELNTDYSTRVTAPMGKTYNNYAPATGNYRNYYPWTNSCGSRGWIKAYYSLEEGRSVA